VKKNFITSILTALALALSLLVVNITVSSCGIAQRIVCPHAAWAKTQLSNAKNDLNIAITYLDKFISDDATVTIPGIGTITKEQLNAAITGLQVTIQGLTDLLAMNCPPVDQVEAAIDKADAQAKLPIVAGALETAPKMLGVTLKKYK
jgi:hypothetical protein